MHFGILLIFKMLSMQPDPICPVNQCLGVCTYNRQTQRCEDTRVKYLGVWDGVQSDWKPTSSYDYPEYPTRPLVDPPVWGTFPLEARPGLQESQQ